MKKLQLKNIKNVLKKDTELEAEFDDLCLPKSGMSKAKHALSVEEISRIWDAFRNGASVDKIAADNGINSERAYRVASAVMEVYEEDVPDMIADRKAGMSKTQIAEKYGYAMAAVRYYLQDVHKGEKEGKPAAERKRPFPEQWEDICRKLNPQAWADRPITGGQEDDA